MPLFTPTRSAQRYLGDAKTKVVHDLLNEQPECEALKIISARQGERFVPDKLEFALSIGYKACPHCLPDFVVDEPAGAGEAGGATGADKARGTGDIKADRPRATQARE
ncbi:MAG TPA: hypothetical protein VIL95_03695 [Bacillota bacterium]